MKLEILSITIFVGRGADQIDMEVDAPSGIWPFEGNAFVKMEIAAGQGREYVHNNFPDLDYKVIKVAAPFST